MSRPNNGPRLEQNDRGIFEVRWSEDGRSRRVSTRTADRSEASRFLAGFILEIERQQEGSDLTVAEIVDAYITEHVAKHVVDKVRQRNIARNLLPYFGDMLLSQIDPKQIVKYEKVRAAGTVGCRRARSSATLRRELNMLKAAIQHAVRTKRITLADVPYIPLPQAPGAKDLWLTEKEADQFMAAARRATIRARLFVAVALNTASRRAAIETLTWEQVDLDRRLIHFNPPGRLQSKKRRVAVPINDELYEELAAFAPDARTGYVLGHHGSITRAFETVTRLAAKETGNKKFLDVTPHTLRHTWATLAARAGVDLYQVAGVLGDSPATVQANYLHHCPDHLRGAVSFRATRQPTSIAPAFAGA